jgi:serine/threonine protein kinase
LSDDEEETTMSPTALREISFMRLLERHDAPHCAKLLDFSFSIADYFALVVYMPKYSGDLSDAISRERLDCRERFQIGCDILQALAFMHACSPPIAHRDMKPENVLLDGQNRGVLADFGFSCFTEDFRKRTSPRRKRARRRARDGSSSSSSHSRASHSGVLGTVTYIAPETLKGAYPHTSADLWSTGVMFLEMLENERLDADTDEDALKLVGKKRKALDETFLVPRTIKRLVHEKPMKRVKAREILATLEEVGLWKDFSRGAAAIPPRFRMPSEDMVVTPGTEALCQKLKAVVPDTFSSAELYSRLAPDMDPRTLAIIASKVHEHRPGSDDTMVKALGIDVEALENAQEELLRRTGGNLLLQSLLE